MLSLRVNPTHSVETDGMFQEDTWMSSQVFLQISLSLPSHVMLSSLFAYLFFTYTHAW